MSYQVLARKWRPRSFASLVGQEHVVRALSHALTAQRLHHAYLFTGTRGVGKTTLARILAKALNCESGVTATPCGTCSACSEIDAGRFVDLLEVDAATNTRVDEMRQLLENAVYAPTRGRFKVYVIDEVHMLSTSAFNAMLKTLEEPPEHVKFVLATTDPQKIPVTVLSRCLQFNLKQMPQAAIVAHLQRILDAETIPSEPAALQLIARSAAGSMRDALSLLDQAIAHGAGSVVEAQVREMLGTVDLDQIFALLEALLAGEPAALLQIAEEMVSRSLSLDAALQELAALLTQVQVAQLAPQAIADEAPERGRLLDLADRLHPEFVQLGYQISIHGRQELSLAPDEQAGFVMTLLRLFTFRPLDVEADERPVPAGHPGRVKNEARPRAPGATDPAQRVVADPVDSASRTRSLPEDWGTLLARLKISGMARELAQHCELREVAERRVVLRLSPRHRHMLMRPAQDKLQQSLSEALARPLQLLIEVVETDGDTPAAVAERDRRQRLDQAIASVESDSFVREVIEVFDATLIESSVRPI